MLKIIIITCVLLLPTKICFAAFFDVQFMLIGNYKAESNIILTNGSTETENSISGESNVNDINSTRSIDALKEITGYTNEDDIYNSMSEDEIVGNILGDLMNELRPYLKDIIDKDISENSFSSKEAMEIITKHPFKFLAAIYNYVVQSIKEIFAIAAKGATIVTE